ncbi:MAG: lytic murein transglycosylase [Desulfobulbaceae bacterium]|nr:MAG: lytic murein transglycosylase [Desulfobulbaceae bacterium]
MQRGTPIFTYICRLIKPVSRCCTCLLLLILGTCLPLSAQQPPKAADLVLNNQPIDITKENYTKLFRELRERHGFSQQELDTLFQHVAIDRKVLELMDKQWEAKPYYEYWPLFITPSVIATGKKKLKEYKTLLDRIEAEIGVDREYVIAIWGIESRFGANHGKYGVFRTLNTLFDAYPRRSKFFRDQLIHFLLLCRENQINPLEVKGSYAGAFGQTQFIPSSFQEYAVSFDGDSRRDVFGSIDDILASIANYLHRFKWTLDAPVYVEIGNQLHSDRLVQANSAGRKALVGWREVASTQGLAIPRPPLDQGLTIVGLEIHPMEGGGFRYIAGYPNFQAITAWNNSNRYAMAVSELAEALNGTP